METCKTNTKRLFKGRNSLNKVHLQYIVLVLQPLFPFGNRK